MTSPACTISEWPKIKLLITEDHTLLRETWSMLFANDPRFEVVASCGSGEEAIELTKNFQPDIVLMDINLPGINGIEAMQLILKEVPATKVLAVSLHTQLTYVKKMIQEGALGYVTKNSPREEMILAILEVKNGRKYICEDVKTFISEQAMNEQGEEEKIRLLTKKELAVIELIQKGLSSKEIAERLGIAIKTVEVHRYNILRKLKLRNSAALINYINQHWIASS
jgi:DNA-binding NarL/FixJ family response regulator